MFYPSSETVIPNYYPATAEYFAKIKNKRTWFNMSELIRILRIPEHQQDCWEYDDQLNFRTYHQLIFKNIGIKFYTLK